MKRPLMGMGIALSLGIIVGFLQNNLFCIFIVCMMCIILKRRVETPNRYILGFSILFFVGFCRSFNVDIEKMPDEAQIIGRIERIQEKEEAWNLFVRSEANEKLCIVLEKKYVKDTVFYKGQIYAFEGEMSPFVSASNPGQFDEVRYYRSQGIPWRMRAHNYRLVNEGDSLHQKLRCLEDLKRNMSQVYLNHMSDDGAAVLCGAVLGDRSYFDEDLKTYYQNNGWMHLITASGFHLSLIAMGTYKKMRKCTVSIFISTLCALILLSLYGYMTDFGDSMIRAMGNLILSLMAIYFGYRSDGWTSTTLMAALMLWFRPARIDSMGFLLTYAAVYGVEFGKWLGRDRTCPKWKQGLWVQGGIFIMTLPLLAYGMYEIPVLGLGYNFFMIPFIGFMIPVVLILGGIGILWPKGSEGILSFGFGILDQILEWIHGLPTKVIVCGCPENWQLIIYVLLFFIAWLLFCKKRHIQGLFVMIIMCAWILFIPHNEEKIVFMDVGQGDGICIFTENGQTIFIDGGSSNLKRLYKQRILPMLKYHGRSQVDVWILTHGDEDHVSGVCDALEDGLSIKCILMSDDLEDEKLQEISNQAKKQNIPVERIWEGTAFESGHFSFTCIFPWKDLEIDGKNNHSLVMEILWRDERNPIRLLMTGDLEKAGEDLLLQHKVLKKVDILKVGHHGSSGSSSEDFLRQIKPSYAIISCSKKNTYGHPHKETLERLSAEHCTLALTTQYGALTVRRQKDGYGIFGYKNKD